MKNIKSLKLFAFIIAGVMLFAACTQVNKPEEPVVNEEVNEAEKNKNETEEPDIEKPDEKTEDDETNKDEEAEKPSSGDFDLTTSEVLVQPEEVPAEDGLYQNEITKAMNAFASSTVPKLIKDSEENEIYSPISLYYALSMIREMADGQTLANLNEHLNANGIDISEELRKFTMTQKFNEGLLVNNSYWIDNKYKDNANPELLNVLKDKFYAYAFSTDFAADGAYTDIDNWALKTTNNMIEYNSKDMFGSPDIVSVILNAVYYESKWQSEFDAANNFTEKFHNLDGSETDAEFMTQVIDSGVYSKGEEYNSALMRMESGNIYYILPKEGSNPSDLLETENFIDEYLKTEFVAGKLTLNLPKYEVESTFSELIQDLGLTDVFGPKADLSKAFVDDSQAFSIGQIIQKAKVIVDEKGAKASAVTGGIGTTSAPNPDKELELNLNRPFMYIITSNRGDVLFVGTVNKL